MMCHARSPCPMVDLFFLVLVLIVFRKLLVHCFRGKNCFGNFDEIKKSSRILENGCDFGKTSGILKNVHGFEIVRLFYKSSLISNLHIFKKFTNLRKNHEF